MCILLNCAFQDKDADTNFFKGVCRHLPSKDRFIHDLTYVVASGSPLHVVPMPMFVPQKAGVVRSLPFDT